MWFFSTVTLVWTEVSNLGTLPDVRADSAMAAVGMDLWVFGGYSVVHGQLQGSDPDRLNGGLDFFRTHVL